MSIGELTAIASLILTLSISAFSPAAAQSLRGSPASINRMYREALGHELYFYKTSDGLRKAENIGKFVRLSGNDDYRLASVSHPYVLPSTQTFVTRLAAQYRAACGEKLVVTSAARPKSYRLRNSVSKTVHPTGMAIDLRRPTKGRCLSWLRETLLHLEGAKVIEATEERNPPHFHVAVFPTSYTRYVQGRGGEVKMAASDEAPTYRVRRGDTLWSIARRHGTSVERLKVTNSIRSSRIVAGQTLVIPGGRE